MKSAKSITSERRGEKIDAKNKRNESPPTIPAHQREYFKIEISYASKIRKHPGNVRPFISPSHLVVLPFRFDPQIKMRHFAFFSPLQSAGINKTF